MNESDDVGPHAPDHSPELLDLPSVSLTRKVHFLHVNRNCSWNGCSKRQKQLVERAERATVLDRSALVHHLCTDDREGAKAESPNQTSKTNQPDQVSNNSECHTNDQNNVQDEQELVLADAEELGT